MADLIYRAPALVIDALIVFIPVGWLFDKAIGADLIPSLVLLPWIWPLYNVIFLRLWGATPARRIMGVSVVDRSCGPLSTSQSIRRHAPDLALAAAMSLSLMALWFRPMPDTTTLASAISAFHNANPWWDTFDDLLDLWIWSELLFLCLDDRRRSLHEVISGTLTVHTIRLTNPPPASEHTLSYVDGLRWLLRRMRPTSRPVAAREPHS